MRLNSNRGAARVSAMWIIVLAVITLAAIAFGFISQSDMAKAQASAKKAQADRVAAIADMQAEFEKTRDTSNILGWRDEEDNSSISDLEAAQKGLEELKAAFPDLGESVTTFEDVIQPIIAAHRQRGMKVAELTSDKEGLAGELSSALAAQTSISEEKDGVIETLRSQLSDQEQNARNRQEELEGRVASANDQNSEIDLLLRQTRSEKIDAERAKDKEILALQTRNKGLAELTRFTKEPHASKADGSVTATSGQLPLGWIDIGTEQRLTTGTRFEVRTPDPDARLKAMCEVTKVLANTAEVVFFDVADRFDPVVAGDVIVNKLFDPTGGRNAVLLGRFSGSYTEPELKVFLERMGINVQNKLDLTTHFLIVGSELYNDPETNEPLEEPIQPSELRTYKDAEASGVLIVPLQDVRQFFSTTDYEG